MSHLTKVQVQGTLTNADVLTQTLTNLGFKNVQHHETPQKLRDYYEIHGDRAESHNSAEIVIPYEDNNISSDAGFVMNNGEFELVADSMDLKRLNERLKNLQKKYATVNIEEQLRLITQTAKGKNMGTPIIEREVLEDGSTRVKLALPSNIRNANQNLRISH